MSCTLAFLKRSSLASTTSERGNRLWADMTPTPTQGGLQRQSAPRWSQRIRFAELGEGVLPTHQRSKSRRPTASTTYDDVLDSYETSTHVSTEDDDGASFGPRTSNASSTSASWFVKNTFVAVEDESDLLSPCALPKRYISSPSILSASPMADDGYENVRFFTEAPQPLLHEKPSGLSTYVFSPSLLSTSPVAYENGDDARRFFPEPPQAFLAPSRSPAAACPSAGSRLHHLGKCKPCAWFFKPQGCQNGAECRHCHSCPKGEIRRRKKERMSKGKDDDEN
eukprot:TRINITY_DN30557_c0_g1_i1.p1 TRINITY_DN30557_c0_g1~~TRINITY_DN30557_c0_g1_i1.p1  ORF type:complete len:281 (+),score=38.45 TRINITY_DN30557_c0_g1_i1:75-917(+)